MTDFGKGWMPLTNIDGVIHASCLGFKGSFDLEINGQKSFNAR